MKLSVYRKWDNKSVKVQKVTWRQKKSHRKKYSKIIKKLHLWLEKAVAVLKVFGLHDDGLELLKTRRLKRGWLGLYEILMKCVLLRHAIKSYREGCS